MSPSQPRFREAGMTSSPSSPLFRFGVVADPQYAALEPNLALNRYPALSLDKLSAAIDTFNGRDLSFVVTLGDIIDGLWESYDAVLPVYGRLCHRHYALLGNHDYAIAAERLGAVVARVGMPAARYDFVHAGHRFIMLDGNAVSLHAYAADDARHAEAKAVLARLSAEGRANAQRWNAGLGAEQLAWLEERLAIARQAGEKAIVLNHYPAYPANDHNGWDSERLVALLAGHDHAVAYFCGHNHAGNYGLAGGTHFLNFRGMVDTPDTSAFAIISVHADRIEIEGFGREESRTLPI